ncbi:Crp/Fnr family transcriptional regulator [Phyllobacterium ifriqiyense]|uniref:Crp/Fnr family transcriptional regulator n=1 Tax=Phyllobacterium ifriqiyense TaxID=314238 RepID=UPI00339760CB
MSMTLIKRDAAETILREHGWLSYQSRGFQSEVLRRSVLLHFLPGQVIYRVGDDLGGIYGIVSGAVMVNTAPPDHAPRLINVGAHGFWTGEGCFLTRGPRRIELRALVETWLMYLPLDQMDQMADANPMVAHNFGQIIMSSVDALIRVIHDLQKVDPDRRIASVLQRTASIGKLSLPLTQTEIGTMARASRRQVNAAMKRFTENGWLKTSYRSITILNAEKLRLFATADDI